MDPGIFQNGAELGDLGGANVPEAEAKCEFSVEYLTFSCTKT